MEREKGIFSLAKENPPVPGCTISRKIGETAGAYALIFSLAQGTDISDTLYEQAHFFYVLQGELDLTQGEIYRLSRGNCYISSPGKPLSVKGDTNVVYLEIGCKEEMNMNKIIEQKGVFQLKDLLPYEEGRIVNEGLIASEGTRFALLSLAAGTALPRHSAPSDALLFALDGEAVFHHQGKDYDFLKK